MATTEGLDRVIVLDEGRGDEAAAVMARAFQDDPLFVHACPDPDERGRWLPWLFRWSVWHGFRRGRTLGIGPAQRLDGVAAVIAPGDHELTGAELEAFGYWRGREVLGPELWDRVSGASNDAFDPADDELMRTVPEPHWYLDVVAVEPSRRGQGLGGALMRAVGDQADADGLPVVLLTFQPDNLPLYQRFGYRVIYQGETPGAYLPWWGMRRDPAR